MSSETWKERIDKMSHEELARLYRFAPGGHPVFCTPALTQHFNARFKELGGMTVEISKRIGMRP